ncbi:MAG TPA: enoyl-CoA hydratase-related protein [Ramlibacter sp.]|nr:enoyl-CoA hydratase-related protein [Ramlibacter sp.]
MTVRLLREGHVAKITIDRPAVLNAIDEESAQALNGIWNSLERDPAVRAIVITGEGTRSFCVGADLRAGTGRSGLDYWAHRDPNGFGGLAMRSSLNVPVIARVNGFALGGGFELLLGCDIVVAAEDAEFGLPEVRVGRLPLDGGLAFLAAQMLPKPALALLLTGQRISATKAMEYGLVTEVVPRENLDTAVEHWVDSVLACAPLSVQAAKAAMRSHFASSAQQAAQQLTPVLAAAIESPDAEEGVRAFREKRKPVWRGRT